MPRGIPRIGSSVPTSAKELTDAPGPTVLGEIRTQPGPSYSGWTEPDGTQIEIEAGPPPWAVDDSWAWNNTDARRFIECPAEWELRWLSEKMLESFGPRGWMPVHPSDSRVRVLNRAMVSPENYIRKGGRGGDILHYMPKHWYEAKQRIKQRKADASTRSSIERLEQTKAEFQRGSFGKHVSLDSVQHPTHTMGEGATMKDE